MTACADQSFRTAGAGLNAAYKALVAKISDDGKVRLKAAVTAGGSIQPTIVGMCKVALPEAQTARLTAQANCAEGDTSCGGR